MRTELAFTAKLKRGAAERAENKGERAETVEELEAALAKFPPVRQFEWCASLREPTAARLLAPVQPSPPQHTHCQRI